MRVQPFVVLTLLLLVTVSPAVQADEELVKSFSLESGQSQVVEIVASGKTRIVAFSDLSAADVQGLCPTTGNNVKVPVCLRLSQENYDLKATGQKSAAQSVAVGAMGGTSFYPNDGVIKLRVANEANRRVKVDLKRKS